MIRKHNQLKFMVISVLECMRLYLTCRHDVLYSNTPGCLTLEDLDTIRRHIWETRTKWFDLGRELKVDLALLNAINDRNEGVYDGCMTEMLSEWLRRDNPVPTWSCIIDALKKPSIGFSNLANELCQKVDIKTTSDNKSSSAAVVMLGKRSPSERPFTPPTTDESTSTPVKKQKTEQVPQSVSVSTSSTVVLGKRNTKEFDEDPDDTSPEKKRRKSL